MKWSKNDLLCRGLPTEPQPSMGRILVTGGTGYIGGRLIPELLARGYKIRVMVRSYFPEMYDNWPEAEIIVGDVFDSDSLGKALEGINTAYYLIHSLLLGKKKFQTADILAAANFRKAAEEKNLKRIIYLGGLGDPKSSLSAHLKNRMLVAQELQKGKVPVTSLRAAIVIGSGSASYEMIKHLVKNCPVFLIPKHAKANCQPIAIRDLIKYLVGTLETSETSGKSYDIGGSDIINYEMMLKVQSDIVNKRRLFLPSFFIPIKFYSYIVSFLTPISPLIVMSLMESCKNDAVCKSDDIRKIIQFEPLGYKESLLRAITKSPPSRSKGILSDINYFFINKPRIPTLIKFDSESERQNYSQRLMQRLGINVEKYKILNIHQIGIDAPLKYVFEELLKWNGDSTCWPNNIARVERVEDRLDNINVTLFGFNFFSLFRLIKKAFQLVPEPSDFDNARYLLYNSSGGYPIGVYYLYVRSSIDSQNEKELTQLFMGVGFNFYGKEVGKRKNVINRIWESIHNRVTENIMNRFKQLCEWRFDKIQEGMRY
ncbi:MAG: hypothetical protein A2X61_02900 [Ignavibacteria bacterium GWB2_35_12]|nr:MAG: hypothetical protein A2X61_02900 [Ignavibacteria bacterium GWB2_35_12]